MVIMFFNVKCLMYYRPRKYDNSQCSKSMCECACAVFNDCVCNDKSQVVISYSHNHNKAQTQTTKFKIANYVSRSLTHFTYVFIS